MGQQRSVQCSPHGDLRMTLPDLVAGVRNLIPGLSAIGGVTVMKRVSVCNGFVLVMAATSIPLTYKIYSSGAVESMTEPI